MAYTVCGEPGSATTTGTDEWHALLDSLLTSAEGGCAVTFWDADLTAAQPTKETVTYSTASRDSAFAWGERMYDQGYAVSVIYDPQTGQYNCSAVMATAIDNSLNFLSCLPHIIGPNELLIINSQAEFDSIFPNCILPVYIDFGTQSLIAAWGATPSNVMSTEANVEYNGNDVLVTINVTLGHADIPEGWKIVFTTSPKISSEQNVLLVVNFQN